MSRTTLVCGSWPPIKCGVGDFSHRLALEWARQGREISVVTDRLAKEDGPPNIRVLPVVEQWGPSALPRILSAIKQTAPDVVNLHYPTVRYNRLSVIDLLPTAIRLALKTPVVTTIHEYSTFQSLGRRRVEWLARTSSAVIVPEQSNQALLKAALPAYADRIHYVPLGSSFDVQLPADFDRQAWRTARSISPSDLLFVYFGFISPSKGIETLLQAFSQLPASFEARLHILADREPSAPQYADYHRMIAGQIEELSQHRSVEWTGYLPPDQLSPYLASADLAVLPFADGASMRRTTLLACIAHGLPVLSTGDSPPCLGVAVVPIADSSAMTQALVELGTNRNALNLLRQQATQASDQTSWSTIATETARYCERYVGSARDERRTRRHP